MIDGVLALAFIGAAWAGWRGGFLRQLVGLGILVGGVLAAIYLRGLAVPIVERVLDGAEPGIVDLAAGVTVFLVVLVGGNVIASRLYRFVPFLGTSSLVDGGLGAVFSVGLRAVELSVVLIIVDSAARASAGSPIGGFGILDALTRLLEGSVVADLLRGTVVPVVLEVLTPFVPETIRALFELPAR